MKAAEAAIPKAGAALHFVGIGGVGMYALARVFLERGYRISGSDLRRSPLTESLTRAGATVYQSHAPEHLPEDVELVIYSSAVPPQNPELMEARHRGLPLLKRAALLGRLMAEKHSIAVAGTHGKTTTAALLALVLDRAGMDPTFLIGGDVPDLGGGARWGQGPYLVAEADEFDEGLSYLRPDLAVVTNIEAEHLDAFGSLEEVRAAFARFMASIRSGPVVACTDDANIRAILAAGEASPQGATRPITYGLGPGGCWQATEITPNGIGGNDFTARHGQEGWERFSLRIPGHHNVSNALGVIAAAHHLGLPREAIHTALQEFHGARRRFDLRGEQRGVTILDDYAHHPTEIRATLQAVRERFGQRHLIVVFQPHLYSRTKLLLHEFATSFAQADVVLLADIYAAREHDTWGVSSRDLAAAMNQPAAHYLGDLDTIVSYLRCHAQTGDVVLTMGAGDVDRVAEALLRGMP